MATILLLCLWLLSGCSFSPPPEPQPLHLTLWQGVNPPPNREILQKLVDRFNQTHPQIQVESLYVGQPDQQMPKILAAVVGNAPPDLLWYNPTITGQLVELEAICPLEDWLATSPLRSQIIPSLFSTMEYEGHTWSVPFATNNVGIFYRPSLFKAAGISELPRTWTELRQVARQLTRDTNGDGKPDQRGMLLPLGQGEFAVFTWLPFLWSAGGELTPPGQVLTPGAIAALQFWSDLIQEGSAVLSLPERGYELDNFLGGKVGMQITGPWTLAQLQQSGVDFDVLPIPQNLRPATALGGENLFIFKTNPERERAAFTFAEYVLSQEFQTAWALGTGYLPVNQRSQQSLDYHRFIEDHPTLAVFLKQMSVAQSRPLFPGYARVSENLGRSLEAVLLGHSSPQEALELAQQRLNLIFNLQRKSG